MNKAVLVALVAALVMLPSVAQAALQITSFTCNNMAPTANAETGTSVTCEAAIQNTDSQNSASMSSVKLYTTGGWSDAESYTGSDFSTSITAGGSTTARFSNIVANVPGSSHKFLNINIDNTAYTDEVTDLTVNSMTFKTLTVTPSASSAASGAGFTMNAYLTAGGSVSSASMTISLSGGCSLSSGESATKSIGSMSNNMEASKSWSITQGSSCSITVTASGTSSPVTITKTKTASVSCSNCGGGGNGGGGGGGGGGGTTKSTFNVVLSTAGSTVEAAKGDNIKFKLGTADHTVTVLDLTNTQVKLQVKSTAFNVTLSAGDTKKIDLDEDGAKFDVSITLDSINATSQKAKLTFKSISEEIPKGTGVIPTGGICVPGEKKCAGTELQACRTDGLDWKITQCQQGCNSTQLVCNEDLPVTGPELPGAWRSVVLSPLQIAATVIIILLLAALGVFYKRKKGSKDGSLTRILIAVAILIVILLVLAFSPLKPSGFVTAGDLAGCLRERGAVLYGASWCGDCREQNALFGDDFSHLDYVDCKKDYDRCVSDGIREIPAWRIGGRTYGFLPLEELAAITGC